MSFVAATGSSSSHAANRTPANAARKMQSDEFEMVRELIRVLVETLLRSRKVPLHAKHLQQKKGRKSLWFNLSSEVLLGVEQMVNLEWEPTKSLVLNFYLDSTLLETWSIRYKPLSSSSTTAMPSQTETRYLACTLLVRQLMLVVETLPAAKYGSNEYTCEFWDSEREPPPTSSVFLSEEFALPGVDLAFGKFYVQVRYRPGVVVPINKQESMLASVSPPSVEEERSLTTTTMPQGTALHIMEDYFTNKTGEEEEEDEVGGEQRWKRWTAETFAERERELKDSMEGGEEIPPPPEVTRQSSTPMNIKPTVPGYRTSAAREDVSSLERRNSASPGSITRKLSSTGMIRKRLGSFKSSSAEDQIAVGHLTDLIGTSPSSLTLPHVLGSLTSNNSMESAQLRTRFLSTSTNSSPILMFSTTATSSLMIYNQVEPMPRLLLEEAAVSSALPNNNGESSKPNASYESALPWILTAAEMERPFSGMAGSILLGATTSKPSQASSKPIKSMLSREESETFTLPFMVAEDEDSFAHEMEGGEAAAATMQMSREDELGAFLLRCREAPLIFEHKPVVSLSDVRAEFNALAVQATKSTTPPPPPPPRD